MSKSNESNKFTSVESDNPLELTTQINTLIEQGYEVATTPNFLDGYNKFVCFLVKTNDNGREEMVEELLRSLGQDINDDSGNSE